MYVTLPQPTVNAVSSITNEVCRDLSSVALNFRTTVLPA
jgi:ABC-type arginine/histidine transport system permease subunit